MGWLGPHLSLHLICIWTENSAAQADGETVIGRFQRIDTLQISGVSTFKTRAVIGA